jgi:hypothetical protein
MQFSILFAIALSSSTMVAAVPAVENGAKSLAARGVEVCVSSTILIFPVIL